MVVIATRDCDSSVRNGDLYYVLWGLLLACAQRLITREPRDLAVNLVGGEIPDVVK